MYSNFIKDFLQEVDVSEEAVTQYLIGNLRSLAETGDYREIKARRKAALPDDFDLEDPRIIAAQRNSKEVPLADLVAAERVCRVFMETTKISIWEVIKETCDAVKNSLSPTKHTATSASALYEQREREVAAISGGNSWPYSLDSYHELSCVMCFM